MALTRYAEAELPTAHGPFRLLVYRDPSQPPGVPAQEHVAIVRGEVSGMSNVLCRVHSECWTSEVIGSLKCEQRARGWLIHILRNCFVDRCRRRRKEVLVAVVPEQVAGAVEPRSPWERATINDVRIAIGRLPETLRTVAILHDFDGLSNSDIAARLGIPYATAATRLHRAHVTIKKLVFRTISFSGNAG